MSDLRTFLSPRSIAVIGATDGVEKIGGRLMSNLLHHRYPGRLYPVNHARKEVHGLPAYPDLASVPGAVDLAILSIPAAGIADALEACAAAGIRHAVIASSGFADAGEEGTALQLQVAALARRLGIRFAGPNTQGFYNVPAGIAATFSPAINIDPGPAGPRRRIGVVSQSGGLGFSLYNRGRRDGLDFSCIVAAGNQADLELVDYAELLLADDETQAVLLFVEAFTAPARFIGLAESAARLSKPLIVAKVGRFQAARRAVASHTGSLAGWDAAYDAIFARYGVIRADGMEEMLEAAAMFTRHKPPRGNRLAIVSASGGTAAWLTDICEAHGLELPELDADRQHRLKAVIPAYGSARNPVDITAQGLTGFAPTLSILADAPELDAIIVCISLAQEVRIAREGEAIAALARSCDKSVLLYTYAAASDKARSLLAGWDLHYFDSMAGCARALRAALAYHRFQETRRSETGPAAQLHGAPPGTARRFLAERGPMLCEYEAQELLAAYGIDGVPSRLAANEDEAVAAAAALGWPVALKAQSPQIPHKTEAGVVRLGIGDDASLRRSYAEIRRNAHTYRPEAEIRGVLVQRMAARGIEMIAGVTVDADFGPMVMCGLGGIHAELFRDVAFAPAPLSRAQAVAMLGRLRAAPLLAGWRGAPPADRAAFAELLLRLSQLALDAGDNLAAIDLNPVILYPEGEGLAVVDALIVPKEAQP